MASTIFSHHQLIQKLRHDVKDYAMTSRFKLTNTSGRKKLVMTPKTRHDSKQFVITSKIRHLVKKCFMTSKIHHDVNFFVKNVMTSKMSPLRQKYVMTSKGSSRRQNTSRRLKNLHDVKEFVMTSIIRLKHHTHTHYG